MLGGDAKSVASEACLQWQRRFAVKGKSELILD